MPNSPIQLANLRQVDALEDPDLPALVGVLPFFHIYGMTVIMNLGLMRRATVVTLPRFELEAFLTVLQDWPIPIAHIVPPIAVALAKHPVVDRYDLSGVEWLFSAAAPLGAELTAALRTRPKLPAVAFQDLPEPLLSGSPAVGLRRLARKIVCIHLVSSRPT